MTTPAPFDADEYAALPEILTVEQAARLLDATVVQVRTWLAEGIIPVTRVGRTPRFSKSRLVAWIAEGD